MTKTLICALFLGALAFAALIDRGADTAFAEVHTGDLHNCEEFTTQKDAQTHLRENPSDPDNLDGNGDGIACYPDQLPCPCDLTPVIALGGSVDDTGGDTSTGSRVGRGGGLCHDECIPEHYSLFGLNPSPGFNRPVAMTFLAPATLISCGAESLLVGRLVYPDGVGAPNRLVTFQSSLGTVATNLLSDYAGYVQTKFVAPLSPAIVQVAAFADGLHQSLQLKADCPQPALPMSPAVPSSPSPSFSPPKTGDGGLIAR